MKCMVDVHCIACDGRWEIEAGQPFLHTCPATSRIVGSDPEQIIVYLFIAFWAFAIGAGLTYTAFAFRLLTPPDWRF